MSMDSKTSSEVRTMDSKTSSEVRTMDSKTSSSSKVRVVVRVRPMLLNDDKPWVQVVDTKTLQTINHRNTDEALHYEFGSVYDSETSQKAVYEDSVKPVVTQVVQGRNASVFAYGPTGAGKTHTILGTPEDPGMIPRCVKDIFTAIQTESAGPGQWNFRVTFSYLEIYNEKVLDLLGTKDKDLVIREDGHKNIFVVGMEEKGISDVGDFNLSFGPASKNRTTACTKLNERSSRSHSVLMLKVQRWQKVAPFCRRTGKMYVIDLAGSEDNRRTGNKGIRLKESGAINSSLLALGQVVDALNKGQPCVPYRSSKLTRLLQDSLGGNAVTCMIVNLAPEEQHYFDTYTTLHFARKTKKIVNTVKINESYDKPAVVPVPVKGAKKRSSEKGSKAEPPAKKPALNPAPEVTPFLSPLLRSQETFRTTLRDEMVTRLEQLEQRLVQQISETTSHPAPGGPPRPRSVPGTSDSPRRSARRSLHRPLEDVQQLRDQLNKLKEDTKRITHRGQATVYMDGSSKENLRQTADISCSPLFTNPPIIRKKKGFRSTASASRLNESDNSASEMDSPKVTQFNPELQKAHNRRILSVLNEGSVKDIQGLQTLGPKRAQLIYDWRLLQGAFTSFDDLLDVEGLNSRFVSTFLKRNLVQE